jgi:hypothetical protein
MNDAPSWHDDARRLIEGGMSVKMTARAVGKAETTVRVALDINGARSKGQHSYRANRARARAELSGIRRRGEASRKGGDPSERRSIERAYADAQPERPLTLPKISIQTLPDEDRRVIRFAPRTRFALVSYGVERWRFHHLKMIREGRIPEPGLPEQLHH